MPPGLYNDPNVPSDDLLDMPSFGSAGNTQFGSSPNDGYTRKALMLSGQQAVAEESAMNYLRGALNSQMDISPEQGIAAAILAAIPSLGGYMIGKSVGKSKYNFADVSAVDADGKLRFANPGELAPTGAMVGGAAGVQQGVALSDDYIKSIEANNKYQGDILQKLGGLEEAKAARLGNDALQFEKASLDSEQEQIRDARNFGQQKELSNMQSANSLANAKAEIDYRNANPSEGKTFSPEMIEYAKANGIDLSNGAAPAQLNAVTNAIEANRREKGQDTRLEGKNIIPPSAKVVEKLDSAILVKSIGNRYISQLDKIAATNPSYAEMNINKILPATEIGKMQRDLGLFAVQLRNAREAGVMTDRDEARYKDYLTIGPLDTLASVKGRMQELQDITDLTAKSTLISAKAGQMNISNYETLLGFEAPTILPGVGGGDSSGSGSSKKLPGETKEQFTARRTQELLAGAK